MSKEIEEGDTGGGDDFATDSRRSRRSLASCSKQGRQNVLEQLKQARAKGKSYRARVDDLVQDVYMELDDEEYQAKKQYYREFVEDDDGAGYCDEESEEDEYEDDGAKGSKKKKDRNRAKAKTGTIKHHFQSLNSRQKPQDENKIRVDDDDILKETLAELIGTSNMEEEEGTQAYDPFMNYGMPSSSQEQHFTGHSQTTNTAAMSPPLDFDFEPTPVAQTPHSSKPLAAAGLVNTNKTADLNKFRVPSPQPMPKNPPIAVIDDDPPPPTESPAKFDRPLQQFHEPSCFATPTSAKCPPPSPTTNPQRKRDASPVASPISRPPKIARTDATGAPLNFYFLDAFEDIYKHPGTVYLFGRVKELDGGSRTECCCIVLKNIAKQLFFLKRPFSQSTNMPVTKEDLAQEVQNTLKAKLGIAKFKCKPNLITKKFISADETVPRECEALEVWANCNFGRIPTDLAGDCFSHVANTTTTALERLLVERNIYGPCWLEIQNAEVADFQVSHCPHEYSVNCEQMDGIRMAPKQDPPPQISLISLNILTALNSETKENQIVMASFINHSCNLEKPSNFDPKTLVDKRFCVISKFKKALPLPFDLEGQLKKNGVASMVKRVGDEMALLNIFLAKLQELNPDMILGHDLNGQLLILQARMEKHKLRKWDRLGRLKRSVGIPKIGANSKFGLWEMTAGRLCLDSKVAATELIHSRSYEMEDLVVKLLKINNRMNMNTELVSDTFLNTNPKIKLIDVIKWNWNENLYTLKIVEHLNAIPLFVQITQTVGGVLSRTLMGGRAERNEYLLLHACSKNNCVPPDKHAAKNAFGKAKGAKVEDKKTKGKQPQDSMDVDDGEQQQEEQGRAASAMDENAPPTPAQKKAGGVLNNNKKTTQYTGGLVLEPKKGLYETYIVLLDFNSLYPSIIQEFNICFTTVDNAFADLAEADLPIPPGSGRPDGILKNEIRKLVSRRREVKNLMKQERPESEKYQQYNIRQMGLKLTANSMYGCLGFQYSRFFAKTLAAMVTSKGRELLMHTKTLVENENFSVIYGDTDSIMVNTNTTDFQQAKIIGQKLKQIVNKNYSLLELDIDGIYQRLLLLKKKKYAALSVDLNNERNVTAEMKGLDIVRRDWSELAKEIGEEIVNLILTPSLDRDTLVTRIRSTLTERRSDLDEGRFALDKFEILKQLTRDPAEYRDLKSQPHATIAQRLNESGKFRLRQGDIVKYIICTDGTNNPATQRGYHSTEILANTALSVDKNYYLAQQIHPVVTRLVEPIDELDAYHIAEVLGLDPTSYRRHIAQNAGGGRQNGMDAEPFSIGAQQDFSACEGLTYECPNCQRVNVIRSAAEKKDNGFHFGLAQCPECGKDVRGLVKKRLRLTMADHIRKNCQVIYTCDDIACGAESCVVGRFQFSAEGIMCTRCRSGTLRKSYTDKKLYDNQCFFKFITDLEAFKEREKSSMAGTGYEWAKKHYKECHSIVSSYLEQSAFNKVDLSVVFAPLIISKK